MSHDRNEPIPDATLIEKEGDLQTAFDRVRKSISDFENYGKAYEPHFMYGKLSKSEYEKAHYLHLADHLSAMNG
jgi:hypothetical protein